MIPFRLRALKKDVPRWRDRTNAKKKCKPQMKSINLHFIVGYDNTKTEFIPQG